jgi:hypothetical protein
MLDAGSRTDQGRIGGSMKVKIFTDVDKSKMEAQINTWLASTKPEPKVKHSHTAINDVSMPVRTVKVLLKRCPPSHSATLRVEGPLSRPFAKLVRTLCVI